MNTTSDRSIEKLKTVTNIISKGKLVKVRGEAKRKRVWFSALGRLERDIINLTVNCVEVVRSPELAKIVTAIVIKLKKALESQVETLVRTIGCSVAQKLSVIAQDWGNKLAHGWGGDKGFARYLAVMHLNKNWQSELG